MIFVDPKCFFSPRAGGKNVRCKSQHVAWLLHLGAVSTWDIDISSGCCVNLLVTCHVLFVFIIFMNNHDS